MPRLLLELLPLALTVAFTLLPIIGTLIVLLSSGRASRGWLITAGYAMGLALTATAATIGLVRADLPALTGAGYVELAAGAALVVVGVVRYLRRRASPTHPANQSALARRLEHLSGGGAAAFGFQFAFHPENLVLVAAASTRIVAAELTPAETVVVIALFCAVAVSTVAVPTLLFATAGTRVRSRLAATRDWLLRNSSIITVAVLVLVGVVLIVIGVYQLARDAG
ncbi:GAP family protein [Leifsonia sp. NPDC058230]|uniref:GAP family protein n=1 Tax=Leifsonia sp. NPDC058230 TaxID=3346391 RepID=UPI0036D8C4BC